MYALGELIWGLLFTDFFAANEGSASGVARDANLIWAVALGTISLAALVTLAIGMGAGTSTVLDGLKTGAVVGFLVWFGVDFIRYGVSNVDSLTAAIVDPLLEIVRTGIGGGVIAAVLGRVGGSQQD